MSVFDLINSERRLHFEAVIQERSKWRDSIRELSGDVLKDCEHPENGKLEWLRCQFRLRLNPIDGSDKEIVATLVEIENNPADKLLREKFVRQVACLLKHDWERAKAEARGVGGYVDVSRKNYLVESSERGESCAESTESTESKIKGEKNRYHVKIWNSLPSRIGEMLLVFTLAVVMFWLLAEVMQDERLSKMDVPDIINWSISARFNQFAVWMFIE